ncbi:MAG: alpha/beta fold hydrolase [Prevotellaceae bacterium]|jgi:dienelactone hydrolase|nr:alpha/beta fold hydrolase [Prevotellaceae bacterium]
MKHFSLFFLFSLGLLLVCCTPMDQIEPLAYKLLKYESADFSSLDKFEHRGLNVSEYGDILFFVDKKITYGVAAIEYTTVDPNNNQVQASGLVYHPINKKSKGIVEMLPFANLDLEGPSDKLFTIEGLPIFRGYTVIVPDLLGFGVSNNIKAPFLMTENTGRVAYDMRRAAANYLWEQFRYQIPSETVIAGYSSGGSAALATQKYYEMYHSNTIKIKEVYAGGGAYDLPAAFAAFAKTEFSDFPAIPHTIFAFDHYYDLHLDFSQIFKDEFHLDSYNWYYGDYSTDKDEKLGTDVRAYMHDDFFKPFDQQNQELKKLHPYLLLNSVSEGWKPKAPIYLYHANDDTYVPHECAEAAVKKFRKAGANISLISYPGNHGTVAVIYLLRLLIRLT